MRISDWSSDVCSSDLDLLGVVQNDPVACLDKGRPSAGGAKNIEERFRQAVALRNLCGPEQPRAIVGLFPTARSFAERDRTSVVEGKSGSVRVDLGGRGII